MSSRSPSVRAAGRVALSIAFAHLLAVPSLVERIAAQERPTPAPAQLSPRMAGYLAFSEGRYDEAIRHWRIEQQRGRPWPWVPEIIETIEARRRLGAIAPADTHRVALIWVTDVYQPGPDGSRTHRPDVTEQERAYWRMEFGALRATVEAFTGGRWTLAFDEVEVVATKPEGSALKPPNPDHLPLERFFLANVDRYDTFVVYSHTTQPSMGLARRYPLVNGVLYGPHRGMVGVSAGGFPLVLHEFFHCIEWVSNGLGGPAHGYREQERRSYPDWHGTTEFDYYRWHFATTLRDRDWRTMNHINRWRLLPSADRSAAHERVLAAYAGIPLAARQEARRLADSARALPRADSARASELYRRALALSPYAPEALLPVFARLRARREDPESLATLTRRIADVRTLTEFAPWDSLAAFGTPQGGWWPEQMTVDGAVLEWEASPGVAASGPHTVTLLRRDGRSSVDVGWVALLEDGREVARQTMPSSISRDQPEQQYQLLVSAYRPRARYTIRAHFTAVGGTDSRGWVLVRRS